MAEEGTGAAAGVSGVSWGLFVMAAFYTFVSEKAMSLQSSTRAWKIPWMEEPGGLQSMGFSRAPEPRAAATEAEYPRARAPQQEKAPQ